MRFRLGFALLTTMVIGTGAASADDSELYETQAVVTGTGETNRQLGFEECFRDVLVKVSGDQRLLADPRVAAALPTSGDLVASFRYRDRLEGIPIHDEQGSYDRPHDLTCTFDRAKVDAVLAGLGSTPWLAERPRLILFLAVERGDQRFMLARDGDESPYMRESLLGAAAPLAMEVDVPDRQELLAAELDATSLWNAAQDGLGDVARRSGGDAPMAGRLAWSDADRGWVADWQLASDGAHYGWQIRGVSFDDAFRNAMSGALQILSGNGPPK
ncbi:DUF2066 domain-containing protein [Arvimicrobium flavum]|uniref:DUF2066 domain-containing protein n=1 Tax=Arvimicrobium flavum TaxID=3393320 RepID=UPI00237A4064|nr:DUF2066 domain-containing protein [Mesorhizobium shangrilense]